MHWIAAIAGIALAITGAFLRDGKPFKYGWVWGIFESSTVLGKVLGFAGVLLLVWSIYSMPV